MKQGLDKKPWVMVGKEMAVYLLVVVAFGLFGCCCTFEGIALAVVFGRKNDLDRAGYGWNADSGGVDSYSAVVEYVAGVAAAVGYYEGNTTKKPMMDY